jgi:hypothetical protein
VGRIKKKSDFFHVGHCIANALNPMLHLTCCYYLVFAYREQASTKVILLGRFFNRLYDLASSSSSPVFVFMVKFQSLGDNKKGV